MTLPSGFPAAAFWLCRDKEREISWIVRLCSTQLHRRFGFIETVQEGSMAADVPSDGWEQKTALNPFYCRAAFICTRA